MHTRISVQYREVNHISLNTTMMSPLAFGSRLVLTWLCVLLAVHAAAESIVSPIQNLGASLAASMAQSTTIAVKSNDDCVILAYQSSSDPSSKLLVLVKEPVKESFEKNGLVLCSSPDSSFASLLSRWRLLAPVCFCTMIGFAADVAHLTKVLAKIAESHQALYSEYLPVAICVRSLSSVLQRAAQRNGGRPYGIQALLVGLDINRANSGGFQLYSCDPTGLSRHFPSGQAVIGRHADSIRKELSGGSPNDAKTALRICVQAILKASKDDSFATRINDDAHTWEALLLWKSATGECEVAQIDSDFLATRFREIREQLESIVM
jgi:20S proteasome alpha/beta subunit